jgi:YegS/Rv2252/BmrU family lipid kinase
MPKIIVILNPMSGRRRAADKIANIQSALRKHIPFEWQETQHPGHAIECAEEAARDGFEVIVAAGGDGTAHEVANGILRANANGVQAALGLLPIGSGNDFAWTVGVPLNDLPAAIERIAQGRRRTVDAGRIRDERGVDEQRYFVNGVGIGFDAMAAIESRKIQRVHGAAMYLLAVLNTMRFYYRASQTLLVHDQHKIQMPLLMGSIANGRRYGGGFLVCPDAQLDDGQLDLCLVPQVSRAAMFGFIPRFMKGTHVKDRRVLMRRGAHVTIQCDDPLPIHADGEIFSTGSRQIDIELLPKALSVIA